MATKYWTGAGTNTNWNSSPTTNWANATYNGSNGNQTAPTTGDSVFFDANSGTGASVWNTAISLVGLDCTGSRNTITHNNSVTFTLTAGDVTLPDGVGSTYTALGTGSVFAFTSTTTTQKFKSNGKQISNFAQTGGASGVLQLQDNLNANASLTSGSGFTWTSGTLDIQTFHLTVTNFAANNTNAKTITGSGTITCNSNQTGSTNIFVISGTNLTVTGFTGTLEFTGTFTGPQIHNITIPGAASTWPCTWSFGANASGGSYNILIGTSPLTIAGLTITGPVPVAIQSGQTVAMSGNGSAVTFNSSWGNEIYFTSNNMSVACAFTCGTGTVTMPFSAWRAIGCSGGATFLAPNSMDLGYNSGVTITNASIGASLARHGDSEMAERIPQGVAYLAVFKAYLTSDHSTEATSKTIAITISKNGGVTFGNPAAGATTATEMASGWYKVTLGTGDTDTLGPLCLRGTCSGVDDIGRTYMVVSANNAGLAALPDTTNIALAGATMCHGTVTTGASTTSVPTSALTIGGTTATGVVANQFVGRSVVFDANTTTAGLRGAQGSITASTASNTPTLTMQVALPATPASGDLFEIV